MSNMRLSDRKCLITGGGSGIGRALATELIRAGNDVLICGRRDEQLRTAKEGEPALHVIQCDVSVGDDRQRLVQEVGRLWGRLDLLVNNAGISNETRVDMQGVGDIAELEAHVNYLAPVHLTVAFLDLLRRASDAAVVNINTGLFYAPKADNLGYCASKAALHYFSRTLRRQLERTTISVFEAFPPRVRTEMMAGRDESMMEPDDVARTIITGIERGKKEIRVGESRLLYLLWRASPALAESVVNRA